LCGARAPMASTADLLAHVVCNTGLLVGLVVDQVVCGNLLQYGVLWGEYQSL
jgi:hypothetical protein